jgi:nicotinamidase-related amidase
MAGIALIVVDFQRGLDDPSWGPRSNPPCEGNVAELVAAWRASAQPVVFVRHDSLEEGSTLRPGQPGNDFKPELTGEPDLLVTKHVNSSFHGSPDLAAWLRERDIGEIAVCGIQTNICAETTARVGSNLGFGMRFVIDATFTHDRRATDGSVITAAELARATGANLDPEFGRVVTTALAISELDSQ